MLIRHLCVCTIGLYFFVQIDYVFQCCSGEAFLSEWASNFAVVSMLVMLSCMHNIPKHISLKLFWFAYILPLDCIMTVSMFRNISLHQATYVKHIYKKYIYIYIYSSIYKYTCIYSRVQILKLQIHTVCVYLSFHFWEGMTS